MTPEREGSSTTEPEVAARGGRLARAAVICVCHHGKVDMFDKDRYGTLLVPIVTPFDEGGNVDYDALVKVGEKLLELESADTLVLTGTTGEFFTMTFDERRKVFETMKEAFGDRVPLIAGTGAASTSEALALTQEAERLGFDTVMIVAPYYTKPTQAELAHHFRYIAERTRVDIMLYNIPIFTGVNIDPPTVADLSKLPNIVAIKEEAELNAKQMTAYLNATDESFIVYCGDDTMVLEALAQGGERIGGFVSGGSHIAGPRIREMIAHFRAGRVADATALQRRLFRLYRILGQGGRTNPVALLKEGMKLMGYPAGLPRLPLMPGTEDEIARVEQHMAELGIIGSKATA